MLQLYLDLLSQPCRSVYIFAKANGIEFQFKEVNLFREENHRGEFKRVSPLGKVPALQDGDFSLTESIAILLYMIRKYKTPDHWYPADLQKRTRVDEYLSWQHMAVRLHGSMVFWSKLLTPQLLGQEIDHAKMDFILKEFNTAVDQFEEKFLQDKPFIVGDKISLADLVAIVELMQPIAVAVDIFKGRPRLDAWRVRAESALGIKIFQEAHQIIFDFPKLKRDPLNPPYAAYMQPKLHMFK